MGGTQTETSESFPEQIALENEQEDLAVLWRKEHAGGRQQTRPVCANAEDCPAAFLKGATVTGAKHIKVGWGWVMKDSGSVVKV